jgi:hypothetical protein
MRRSGRRRRDPGLTVTVRPPEAVRYGKKEECGFNYTINQGIFSFPRGVPYGTLLQLAKGIYGEIFLI